MARRLDSHPSWCSGGHRCTVDRGGEHRSDPLAFEAGITGKVIITRTESRAGHNRLEVRAVIELPAGAAAAAADAAAAVTRLCQAAAGGAPR